MLRWGTRLGLLVGTLAVSSFLVYALTVLVPGDPALPGWLVARYRGAPFARERTAQLVRVFTHPEHRRRGVARALIQAARAFVAADGGYDVLCLHTEHAAEFWRGMGATVVCDPRTPERPDASVHLELV